jgi:hypothetical protein
MKVIETIQSTLSDEDPVDVVWYTGDSGASAISALATIVANASDPAYYPEYFTILSARIEF